MAVEMYLFRLVNLIITVTTRGGRTLKLLGRLNNFPQNLQSYLPSGVCNPSSRNLPVGTGYEVERAAGEVSNGRAIGVLSSSP